MILIRKANAYAIVNKDAVEIRGNTIDVARIMVASALRLKDSGYNVNNTLDRLRRIEDPNPQTNSGDSE